MGNNASSNSHPDEGSAPDRLLFDFGGFLEGGALDDVFGIPPESTSTTTPTSKEGGWEVTKLSGRSINDTVRIVLHRGDNELGRNPGAQLSSTLHHS